MRRCGFTLVVAACFLAGPTKAEQRIHIFASGHWMLDKVDGLVVPFGRDSYTVDGMCNAYSPPGDVQLTFSMIAKEQNAPPEQSDALFIRVTSPKWNFAYKEAAIFLIGGTGLTASEAWYAGSSITWEPSVSREDVADFVASAGESSLFVGTSGSVESNGDILVIDADDHLLGRIPADGLSDVFAKLRACAGPH